MLYFLLYYPTMIIDGRAIAQDILNNIKSEIDTLDKKPRLTVFTCAPNFETQKFLALKKRRAVEVGVDIQVIEIPADCETDEVVQSIRACIANTDGIVVQLPFPQSVDTTLILQAIPATHDVDAIHYLGDYQHVLPPVVGAIKEIADRESVVWQDKNVVIVGKGRLVGEPAALFVAQSGGVVTVLEKDTLDNDHKISQADILILGAGVPGLIRADMIKAGVLIFDAGTSEEGGMLVGDAAVDAGSKAALLTPVPGGIGPITIAVLLRNLLFLTRLHGGNIQNML